MGEVQIGNWRIKASSLDDQILLFIQSSKVRGNVMVTETIMKMFYCEEKANQFVEGLLKNDTSNQATER